MQDLKIVTINYVECSFKAQGEGHAVAVGFIRQFCDANNLAVQLTALALPEGIDPAVRHSAVRITCDNADELSDKVRWLQESLAHMNVDLTQP